MKRFACCAALFVGAFVTTVLTGCNDEGQIGDERKDREAQQEATGSEQTGEGVGGPEGADGTGATGGATGGGGTGPGGGDTGVVD